MRCILYRMLLTLICKLSAEMLMALWYIYIYIFVKWAHEDVETLYNLLNNNNNNNNNNKCSMLLIWLFCFHILSCSFGSIFYHIIYCYMLLSNFVNYIVLLLGLCTVIVVFVLFCIFSFHVPTGTRRLSWLRFFRAFSSVVRQMPGCNSQIWGTARTLPN